jgi:hypothetical protein
LAWSRSSPCQLAAKFLISAVGMGNRRLVMETRKRARGKTAKRWVRKVKTVSTAPPQGLFAKDAHTIARVMATKKVSPKGLGSAIRMVQYFINEAERNCRRRGAVSSKKRKGSFRKGTGKLGNRSECGCA